MKSWQSRRLFAQAHLQEIDAALVIISYDWELFSSSGRFDEMIEHFEALDQVDAMLESYLEDECGESIASLQKVARKTAEGLRVDDPEPDARPAPSRPSDSLDYVEIVDSANRLKVTVPTAWTDVTDLSTSDGGLIRISPDTARLERSWGIDGISMSVQDASSSPIDWRAPMYDTAASQECSPVSSVPYSDSLYTGWIDTYENCGGSTTAVVIGATDEDFSIEILIQIQFDGVDTATDEEVLKTILDTFKAR